MINLILDGDLDGVRDALNSGVGVNIKYHDDIVTSGKTALDCALETNHFDIACLLLEAGGISRNKGLLNSSFRHAASTGHAD